MCGDGAGDAQAIADTNEVRRWAAALGADGAARLVQPGVLPGADLPAVANAGTWTAAPGSRTNGIAPAATTPPRATLGRDTRVLREDGSRAGRDALHAGQVIRLWHEGPVMESYPVLVGARIIVLERAGS